jgi:hypothetical protein
MRTISGKWTGTAQSFRQVCGCISAPLLLLFNLPPQFPHLWCGSAMSYPGSGEDWIQWPMLTAQEGPKVQADMSGCSHSKRATILHTSWLQPLLGPDPIPSSLSPKDKVGSTKARGLWPSACHKTCPQLQAIRLNFQDIDCLLPFQLILPRLFRYAKTTLTFKWLSAAKLTNSKANLLNSTFSPQWSQWPQRDCRLNLWVSSLWSLIPN